MSKPMTREELDELRVVTDAATGKPWRVQSGPDGRAGVLSGGTHAADYPPLIRVAPCLLREEDARFAVAAREAVPRMLDQLAEAERFRAAIEKIVDEALEREPETAWVPNELRRLLKRTDSRRRPAAARDLEPRCPVGAEPELLGLRPMNEAVLGPRVEVAARGRRVCADPDRAAGTGERSMSGTVAKRMSPRELAARLRLAAAKVELWEFEPPGLKERYELAGELEDLRDQADPSRDPEGV